MPTYTPIYTRSPRIITLSGTAGDEMKVELFLWNNPSSQPANPTYTMSKPIPATIITSVDFDIAPFCDEHIKHLTYTSVTSLQNAPVSEYSFCTVKTYVNGSLTDTLYYVCFAGFGFHNEGKNPTVSPILLEEGEYYYEHGVNSGGLFVLNDATTTWSATYTNLVTGATSSVVLSNFVNVIPYVFPSYLSAGNTLQIYKTIAAVPTLQKTFTFTPVCEPRYTTIDCDFVNKNGAWQRLIFFKASYQNYEASGEEFHLMPASSNYGVTEARRQTFNRNAKKSIRCNTGFVPESYKEVMKQLLLSETIVLDGVPVKLRTQGVELQEHITKKLINYQIEFEYAYNERQYIL
jgi:hypothetical protein